MTPQFFRAVANGCMVLAVAALLVFGAQPAFADVTGVVRGIVTVDGTGAAGVRVTLAGEGTSAATKTDAQGRFMFPQVGFGRYTVSAQSPGKPAAESPVEVSSGSVSDVALSIGAVREIGRTNATSRGVAGNPVSVATFSGADVAAMPQNQSLNRLVETVPGIVQFSY